MGREKSEALVKVWNQDLDNEDFLIVYGCAGALTPKHRVGETFVISHLVNEGSRQQVLHPATSSHPQATVTTSTKIISTSDEKRALHRETSADLVDMEMFYLWEGANPHVQRRLIFVRGVLDQYEDNLQFVNRPAQWLKPHTWLHATTILRRLKVYLRSMEDFLKDPRFWNSLN